MKMILHGRDLLMNDGKLSMMTKHVIDTEVKISKMTGYGDMNFM